MSDIWIFYSSFASSDEAVSVAEKLLENRLVACVNIHPGVTSLYRWEGAIQRESEVVLVAKTAQPRLQAAMEMVKRLHSYELPCIIAYPIGGGYPSYLKWIEDEVS